MTGVWRATLAWVTDVLSRISNHKINRIDAFLPRSYASRTEAMKFNVTDAERSL